MSHFKENINSSKTIWQKREIRPIQKQVPSQDQRGSKARRYNFRACSTARTRTLQLNERTSDPTQRPGSSSKDKVKYRPPSPETTSSPPTVSWSQTLTHLICSGMRRSFQRQPFNTNLVKSTTPKQVRSNKIQIQQVPIQDQKMLRTNSPKGNLSQTKYWVRTKKLLSQIQKLSMHDHDVSVWQRRRWTTEQTD